MINKKNEIKNVKDLITLEFNDVKLESEFKEFFFKRFYKKLPVSVLLGLFIYVSFSFFDIFLIHEAITIVWSIRITVFVLGIVFVIFRKKIFNRILFLYLFSSALILLAGLGLLLSMNQSTEENRHYYFFGFCILIFWSSTLYDFLFKYTFFTSIFLILLFEINFFYFDLDFSRFYFVDNFFVIVSLIIGLLASYKIEEQLRAQFYQKKQLEIATDKYEKANISKGEFLANMSHEMRTPMNAILGISKMLTKYGSENLKDQQVEDIKMIQTSGQRLLDLINDILDLSKIEADKMTVENKPFLLDTLISDIKCIVEPLIKDKNIRFIIRKSEHLPDTLISDQKKIMQILVNLLGNSVKFTEKGKIILRIFTIKNNLYFEVNDTGIGIEESYLASIFDKFVQVESSISKKYKGTGLGLALCKNLVELLHGEIGISSEPGKGTLVWFHIPFTTNAETIKVIAKDSARKSIQQNNKDLSQDLILLIKNDSEIVYFLRELLQANNYKVIYDLDGLKGFNLVNNNIPNLIILDLKMPKLTGFEIMNKIKYNPELNKIPILISSEDDEYPNKAEYHYFDCLPKINDEAELQNSIKEALSYGKRTKLQVAIVSENIQDINLFYHILSPEFDCITILTTHYAFDRLKRLDLDFVFLDLDNFSGNILSFYKDLRDNNNQKLKNVTLINIFENSHIEKLTGDENTYFIKKSELELNSLFIKIPKLKITKQKKVLLINNDKLELNFFEKILGREYELLNSSKYHESINIFLAEKPQLIILDFVMEKETSIQTLSVIREHTDTTPVLALISKEQQNECSDFINIGINDIIVKPFDEQGIKEKLSNIIAKNV